MPGCLVEPLMGRHTAPIPVIRAAAAPATGPITDPHLLDPPGRSARTGSANRASPLPPAPRGAVLIEESDGLDELHVDVIPRSVRSVLEAEEEAAANELPPPPFPRLRDLTFAGASLVVLGAAVTSMLLP